MGGWGGNILIMIVQYVCRLCFNSLSFVQVSLLTQRGYIEECLVGVVEGLSVK
jgi:hypothetical protein